jgi:hypothetical protein
MPQSPFYAFIIKNNKKIEHKRNFLVTAGYKPSTFSSTATAAVARGHY